MSISELCDVKTRKHYIEVELEEKNVLPSGYERGCYESKGFLSCKRVQDFPLRGKALYLNIRRRRWRHKETKDEVRSDYSFIADGAKLTQELADFLKGTGRDPRRYH
jgi:hypothetical protein